MHENRETPLPPTSKRVGRKENAMSDQSFMNGGGESVRQNDRRREYSGVVPMKQPNKSGRPPAEAAEEGR